MKQKTNDVRLTEEQINALRVSRFPRSAKYDPQWVLENRMGPNAMWLAEWLSEAMDFSPGMRVLDLGCGTAITSIFLAKEFGVQVWATDNGTWIKVRQNWQRIREVGVENLVFPIFADAHAMPYSEEFFDAMVSIDAYHYFGTSDTYFANTFVNLVKPGGQVGIVVPGLMQEFDENKVPQHLEDWWYHECYSFHAAQWWRWHWERTKKATVEIADTLPDGWRYWLLFEEISHESGIAVISPEEKDYLQVDKGRYLGFVRMVARRQ